jgi:hypothetical protein
MWWRKEWIKTLRIGNYMANEWIYYECIIYIYMCVCVWMTIRLLVWPLAYYNIQYAYGKIRKH